MNTKRIKNALLEMTFHEKFNINKFWGLKKNVFKNDVQHKFAVIESYGNEQTESNIIKTERKKEFQQRLESRQITPKYRNIQEITNKIFDTVYVVVSQKCRITNQKLLKMKFSEQ